VQTVVSNLVDVQAPALTRGMSEPASQVLKTQAPVLELDNLEDDPPWPTWFGHVNLDAEGKPRSGHVIRIAVAALGGRDPFAFVAGARRGQRPACARKAFDVGLEERLVEMGGGMTPTPSAWADDSALVVGGIGRAIGALKLI
jgi:hypothetical protein